MLEIPNEYKNKIINRYGAKGEEWLENIISSIWRNCNENRSTRKNKYYRNESYEMLFSRICTPMLCVMFRR